MQLNIPEPLQKKLDELGLAAVCTSDSHRSYIYVCYAKQMKHKVFRNELQFGATCIDGLPCVDYTAFDVDLIDLSEACRPWLIAVCWACENYDSPIVDSTAFSRDIACKYEKFKNIAAADGAVEQYKKEMFEKEEEETCR